MVESWGLFEWIVASACLVHVWNIILTNASSDSRWPEITSIRLGEIVRILEKDRADRRNKEGRYP